MHLTEQFHLLWKTAFLMKHTNVSIMHVETVETSHKRVFRSNELQKANLYDEDGFVMLV